MNKTGNRLSLRYLAVNSITFYRLVASVLLLYFILGRQYDLFKWFLALSFFTDAIDGFLARRFKVVSVMGAKVDSIADDLTVLVGMIGLYFLKQEFFIQNIDIPFFQPINIFLVPARMYSPELRLIKK